MRCKLKIPRLTLHCLRPWPQQFIPYTIDLLSLIPSFVTLPRYKLVTLYREYDLYGNNMIIFSKSITNMILCSRCLSLTKILL